MTTTRLIQWNMGFMGKLEPEVAESRMNVLQALLEDCRPSILTLQESPSLQRLRARLGAYELEEGPKGLVTSFQKGEWLRTRRDDSLTRAFAVEIEHTRGRRLRIWNVHAPTINKSTEQKRAFFRGQFRRAIEQARTADPDRDEIVSGDFNLPPFDPAVVLLEDGLGANRCLSWTENIARRRATVGRPLFNPSWQLFGNVDPPHGTFYRSEVDADGPWSILDQSLIAPSLALKGRVQVRVIVRAGTQDLCKNTPTRAPNSDVGSDHLPVCLEFQL